MTAAAPPTLVNEYLRVAGSAPTADVDPVLACFADDAEVHDFDDVRIGAVAIRQWWHGPVTACGYSVVVLSGHALGTDRLVAFSRLVGEFPGGTVELVDPAHPARWVDRPARDRRHPPGR